MLTCIDTCCLINLLNSGVFLQIIAGTGRVFQFQGLVEDELISHKTSIGAMLSGGHLIKISGSAFTASEVASIAIKYNLGVGESECIAICLKTGVLLTSDDRKARIAAIKELAKHRVTGSLGLLRDTVNSGQLTATEAVDAVTCMRKLGAFIPNADAAFFSKI